MVTKTSNNPSSQGNNIQRIILVILVILCSFLAYNQYNQQRIYEETLKEIKEINTFKTIIVPNSSTDDTLIIPKENIQNLVNTFTGGFGKYEWKVESNDNKDNFIDVEFSDGSNFEITKYDASTILKLLLVREETMYERFVIQTLEMKSSKKDKILLFDKYTGQVWLMDNNINKFELIEIENLEDVRKKNNREELIDYIINKTGKYKFKQTEKINNNE